MGAHNVSEKQSLSPKTRRFTLAERRGSGLEFPEQEGPGVTFWKYVGKVASRVTAALCVQSDETLVTSQKTHLSYHGRKAVVIHQI